MPTVLRLLLLSVMLLFTAATSVRRPDYPKVGQGHQGSVYLHNARLEKTSVEVAGLEAEATVDCEALERGVIDGLAPDDFVYRQRWEMSPGENLPLRDDRLETTQRSCHAALVRIGDRDWLVHWRDGEPPSEIFSHVSQPGSPPTAGGLPVTGDGSRVQVHPRTGVTVRALGDDDDLSRDRRAPGTQAPGAIEVQMQLDGRTVDGDGQLGDADTLITAGGRWRIVFGDVAGAATGADFSMGSTNTGGFATELNTYFLGLGLHNELGMIGIAGGGGLSWVSGGRVPFAWQLPVELFSSVKLGDRLRLGSFARAQWVFDEDSRQNGSASAPFGDELQLGVSLHWVAIRHRDFSTGMGLSLTYSEQQGVEMWGLSLGGAMWQTPGD